MVRLTIGCLIAALATASVAVAQQAARMWILNDDGETVALIYGTPDSDDIVTSITCEPAAKLMRVTQQAATTTSKPGDRARLKLSNGAATVELTGDAVANELSGTVQIEVVGPPNARLIAVLKAGPSLTIEVPGGKETLPLTGVAEHLPTLEKACLARR